MANGPASCAPKATEYRLRVGGDGNFTVIWKSNIQHIMYSLSETGQPWMSPVFWGILDRQDHLTGVAPREINLSSLIIFLQRLSEARGFLLGYVKAELFTAFLIIFNTNKGE